MAHIQVFPAFWQAGTFDRERNCVRPAGWDAKPLPENFVTHELLDLNADDPGQLADFSREYGLLFNPVRWGFRAPVYCEVYKTGEFSYEETHVGEISEAWSAIETTDELRRYGNRGRIAPFDFWRSPVSMEEARCTAVMLQLSVKCILADYLPELAAVPEFLPEFGKKRGRQRLVSYRASWNVEGLTGETQTAQSLSLSVQCIDAGLTATGGFAIPKHDSIMGENWTLASPALSMCLTNAICNQLYEMARFERYDFSICPRCGRVYKKMRHDKREPKRDTLPESQQEACSDTCEDRLKSSKYYFLHKSGTESNTSPGRAGADSRKSKH